MKYSVGDELAIHSRKHGHGFKIGDIIVVLSNNDGSDPVTPYHCRGPRDNTWWLGDDEVTLYKRAKAPRKYKYKVGDKVIITRKNSSHSRPIGTEAEITKIDPDDSTFRYEFQTTEDNMRWGWLGDDDCKLLSRKPGTRHKTGDAEFKSLDKFDL